MFVVGVFNCTLCVCISFFLSLLLSGCAALMRNKVYIVTDVPCCLIKLNGLGLNWADLTTLVAMEAQKFHWSVISVSKFNFFYFNLIYNAHNISKKFTESDIRPRWAGLSIFHSSLLVRSPLPTRLATLRNVTSNRRLHHCAKQSHPVSAHNKNVDHKWRSRVLHYWSSQNESFQTVTRTRALTMKNNIKESNKRYQKI